jgi:hydroxypyruvate reductase
MNARRILLELFDAALRAVDGRACTARFLREAKLPAPVAVFAVGKAASAMAMGARDVLGSAIQSMLIVTKHGHSAPELDRDPRVLQLETAHPVPDESSLAAGAGLESRVAALPPGVLPLFLISGGSSSLVEVLADGVGLGDLQALNQRGLAAGWDIAALNAERAKLSRLKAGGVARLLGRRRALALFISDVPTDDPDVIGSGLLGSGGGSDLVERHIVANVDSAVSAVIEAALARGLEFQSRAKRFDGDAAVVAEEFLAALRATSADGLVWGGESTVKVPDIHGRGGRNTHLALTIARGLRPGERLLILAAGTDGTDGPTSDAGAIVDADSIDRATLEGCDVERAWREFDSGAALEAAEDLVHTGPTGTNVGDILIAVKQSATSLRGQPPPRML